MAIKHIILWLILWLCTIVPSSYAAEVSLDALWEYQQLFEQMEVQWALSWKQHIKKRRCIAYDRWTYMAVSPACFLQSWMLPTLSFTEAIDVLMPYVENISAIYDADADSTWYTQADLIFRKDIETLEDWDIWNDTLALQLFAHHALLIQVPKVILAYEQIKDYAFFGSVRDTTTYGACRAKNYAVAMWELDGVLLAPWDRMNMNDLIAHHPDYCTWTAWTYMFYQWVCGWSTQLFWNALVNPYLYVVERHAHGEFWQNFYGSMGKDASIYENSKKMIIENIGNEPVYFRTFTASDGNTVLVSAYPKKEWLRSYTQAQQTWKLSAELINKVTDAQGGLKFEQERKSNYWGINDTKDL